MPRLYTLDQSNLFEIEIQTFIWQNLWHDGFDCRTMLILPPSEYTYFIA